MHMKMGGRVLAAALLSLAMGCQGAGDDTQTGAQAGTQEAKVEAQCIERFEGIRNCAIGNATLTPTDRGLDVSGLVDPKEDGVSSNFDGAVRWTQEASIRLSDGQGNFSLAARDGDQVVSTLQVTRGREPNQIALAPNFTGGSPTGASYRVNVYQDNRLVATTDTTADRYIIIWWWDWWWWWFHWDFYLHRSADRINDGACVWRLRAGEGQFTARVDGRDVTGDAIEFVEHIKDGAYPYTSFSGIDIRGDAKEYSILGESSSRE
jgi:hypothetical protein